MDGGRRILNRTSQMGFIFTLCIWLNVNAQSSISSFSIFEENGSKGIISAEGKEVIPASYRDLGWTNGLPEFHQNVMGYRESEMWGLINSNNKIVTPPKYSNLYPAKDSNLIIAAIPGRFSGEVFFGLINAGGKVVIPFMYAGIEVADEVAIVKTLDGNRSKYGLINMSNDPVLPFQYLHIKALNKDIFAVTKKNRKIVLMSSVGKEIIRYEIDSLKETKYQYYRIFNQGKVGLIDNSGRLVLSPEYKKIDLEESENNISFLRFHQWNFLSASGDSKQGLLADDVLDIGQGIFRITLNNQSWLADQELNILSIPYDQINPVSKYNYEAIQNGKSGLLNSKGIEILKPEFDNLIVFGPYVFTSKEVGSRQDWWIFDTLGIQKNHFIYQNTIPVKNGLIPVKRNNKWGFMSRTGEELIHCVYDFVSPFQNGKSIVTLHGEQGIIDKKGNWLLLPGSEKITMVNDTMLLESSKYQNRLITLDNKLIYFTENELIWKKSYFSEIVDSTTTWHLSLQGTIINNDARRNIGPIPIYDSLLIVYQADKTGVVSQSGREVIPFGEWDEIYPPTQEFLGIKDEDFYGFIDINNKLRIANRYEGIGPFNEGLAAIKVRGKWGFINKNEDLVCQPLYNEVGEFNNGVCAVRIVDKWGLLNDKGKLVQPVEFESIEHLPSGFIMTLKDGASGLLDEHGSTILFPKYEELEVVANGMILVKRRGLYGLLDKNGVNLLPTLYNDLSYVSSKDEFLSMIPGVWETRSAPVLME